MHYEDFLSSQSACGRAELLRTEIGGRFCYHRASKVLLFIYFLVLFVWYCTDPNTLSYPTRRGNWATYKRWKSEHDPFPQLFPGIWCKIVKMFRYIKKRNIYLDSWGDWFDLLRVNAQTFLTLKFFNQDSAQCGCILYFQNNHIFIKCL